MVFCLMLFALWGRADNDSTLNSQLPNLSTPSYTNHAGNVVSGAVIALDVRTATISNAMETVKLPLSIFPEPEQRRIAADFVLGQGGGKVGLLRVPESLLFIKSISVLVLVINEMPSFRITFASFLHPFVDFF